MNRAAEILGGARVGYWLVLFAVCMAGAIHAIGELAT